MATYVYKWEGVEKLVLRYVRTRWMAPNKCCGIFFVHWFRQVHQSIPAIKENVIVFFHHNYDYFILCNNQNLRSFTYHLQVSETEGLAELHWVIGLSVLEKINSIYFQELSLVFSRMFFQESKCAFKHLSRKASQVTSLHEI